MNPNRPEPRLITQRGYGPVFAADHLAACQHDAVFVPALDAAAVELLAVQRRVMAVLREELDRACRAR